MSTTRTTIAGAGAEPLAASPAPRTRGPRVCLFGAAPDTGNHGVSALCFSVLEAMARRIPGLEATVFDYARGERTDRLTAGGQPFAFRRAGAFETRRLHRPECLWNIRVRGWLGLGGSPAAEALGAADAVLDISGGDSFGDLYGRRRFRAIVLHKLLALERGKPLLLLPQTYGPFSTPRAVRAARAVVMQAGMAWARDQRSLETLRGLLGSGFDERIHRSGVDVAFGLEARPPAAGLSAELERMLERSAGAPPLAGVNVSGLIHHSSDGGRAAFGLRADYRAALEGFLRRLLRETEARVLLVPHVITPPGHYESDPGACQELAARLEAEARGRIAVLPPVFGPGETKWILSRLDWFCGTRMHATIGSLSSGVPTAALAYSLKTQGVFESCGQGDQVVDLRSEGTEAVTERLWSSFSAREEVRARLAQALPGVLEIHRQQMDEIASFITAAAARGRA